MRMHQDDYASTLGIINNISILHGAQSNLSNTEKVDKRA